MIKTFLINLDKNPERLTASTEQLKALGVSFERIPAVYGRNLSVVEKKNAVNRFRWWCAQGRPIRDGEIGCALSHKIVYERMIRDRISVCCVLEDDNRYRDDFKHVRDAVLEKMDVSRPQVVQLSNCTDDRASSPDVQIVRSGGDQWTSSYLITLPAAQVILKANYPIQMPCDGWRRWSSRGLIEFYHAFPTVAVQDGHPLFAYGIDVGDPFESDVEGVDSGRVSNFSLRRKILHKFMRIIGVALDRVLPL